MKYSDMVNKLSWMTVAQKAAATKKAKEQLASGKITKDQYKIYEKSVMDSMKTPATQTNKPLTAAELAQKNLNVSKEEAKKIADKSYWTGSINSSTNNNLTNIETWTGTWSNTVSETNTWSLWTTSSGNIMADKLWETGTAFEQRQKDTAKELSDVYNKSWEKQSELIAKSQEAARQRYDAQQAQLDKNKAAAEWRIERSRWMADEILKRQEAIAARQANIWAAQAGQSWLQMSASAVNDVKNDMIATYGTNLANAEQFRLQTNMSLDDALTKVASDIFSNKQAVDNFVNLLDKEELAPLLAATVKAEEWDVNAINSIKDYYNAILNKKAEEEYNKTMEFERYEDQQRQWVKADQRQKGDMLFADLKEDSFVMDQYWANPDKYKNMSLSEAVTTLRKEAKKIRDLDNQWLVQYMINKTNAEVSWKPFTKVQAYEDMIKAVWWTVLRNDATAEAKTEARWDTWTSTTELIKPTEPIQSTPTQTLKPLTAKDIAAIDDRIKKSSKQKVVDVLTKWVQDWKMEQVNYDRIMQYINSKY